MSDRAPDHNASADFAPTFDEHRGGGATAPVAGGPALESLPSTPRMPVLFLGHGNPMNALADNHFTRALNALGADLPRPTAALCVSAHWMTQGDTRVLNAEKPRTIHDFYGFPAELYEVRYPAGGSPQVAEAAGALTGALADGDWGLDHGAWTVLVHLWPNADVPVLELSIDMAAPPEAHLELGRRLAPLREHGVLVMGSGNIVHNLRAIDWDNPDSGLRLGRRVRWVGARPVVGGRRRDTRCIPRRGPGSAALSAHPRPLPAAAGGGRCSGRRLGGVRLRGHGAGQPVDALRALGVGRWPRRGTGMPEA